MRALVTRAHPVKTQLDLDEAPGALEDELSHTPASDRLALLVKRADDPHPAVRYAAADALGNAHGRVAADALSRAFRDSSAPVRQRAMETLPNVDATRGLTLLLAGLVDEDLWIRQAALGQIVTLAARKHPLIDRRAAPTLIRALDDNAPSVRFMAVKALNKITGKPWTIHGQASASEQAAVVREWKAWWAATGSRDSKWRESALVMPIRPDRSDPAPPFHLTDIDGSEISLAGQRGRVTLINFWGTWCAPCQQEIPDLTRLYAQYHARGLDVLGVALSESSAEDLRRWCAGHGVQYRQALGQQDMQEAYGHVEEVPVSVLIDRQGRIRYRWEGEQDFETFRAAVERLL